MCASVYLFRYIHVNKLIRGSSDASRQLETHLRGLSYTIGNIVRIPPLAHPHQTKTPAKQFFDESDTSDQRQGRR